MQGHRGRARVGLAAQLTRGGLRWIAVPMVHDGLWPLLIVAPHEDMDPIETVAGDLGHLSAGFPLSEQPEHLPVALLHGISGLAITGFELFFAQIRVDCRMSSYIIIIQRELISGGARRMFPYTREFFAPSKHKIHPKFPEHEARSR